MRHPEKNFFIHKDDFSSESARKTESKELKKKIRNFVLAGMALMAFGGGVEVGRQQVKDELKKRDTVERLDDRKEPEIIIDDGAVEPEDDTPERPTPPPAPERKREWGRDIETEFAHKDSASFDQLFDFNKKGKFKNADKVEKCLENHWLEYYSKNKNMLAGKQKAFKELSQWLPAVNQKISEFGIEDKELQEILPLLSIVENEKITDRKANAKGAAGAFGITSRFGGRYVEMSPGIDARLDPIEAGLGSYKLLRDNKKGIGDTKLAVAAYNGKAWKFVNQMKARGEDEREINFHNYIRYSVDNLNKIKEEAESGRWEIHKAKPGESLMSIARKYNQSGRQKDEEKIFQANESISRKKKMRGGEEIYIPLQTAVAHSKEELIWACKMRSKGINESLDYANKIWALKTLAKRGYFKETKPGIKFNEAKLIKSKKGVKIAELAKKHGVPIKAFREINPKFTKDKIYFSEQDKKNKQQEVNYRVPLKKIG